MAARPRLSVPAFVEARRMVRSQARVTDARIRAWCDDAPDRNALHDARTALRRLRVLVRCFKGDLGSLGRRRLRRRMQRAFKATSRIRDRDVFAAWLPTLPSSPASRHLLRDTETDARARAGRARRELRNTWREMRAQLFLPKRKVTLPARSRTFGAAAAAAIRAEADEVNRGLTSHGGRGAVADLHRLRIAAKRLRYLLEAIAGRSPDVRRSVEWCRAFQDLVGDWRDAALATRRARACPPLPGRDALIDRLAKRRRDTRVELRRFARDRGAWTAARREVLTICRRYRLLGRDTTAGRR